MKKKFRSAVSGRYVKKETAKKNPRETVSEKVCTCKNKSS
jgi:hypothetical protein